MSTEPIIVAKDLNLSYKFINRNKIKNSVGSFLKNQREKKSFHAVKDVSFTIQHGENTAIIGTNGSGKSTLLRMLAGTLIPDFGSLEIHSESTSLLALGAGVNPNLTGRENIYLSGLLLGLTKGQIDDRIEEMIEFAEIGEFIDHPMKTYSSGMVSRLSFSVVSSIEPDLLLIDELFSVGDAHFRKKSGDKIQKMIDDDRTVVMVSHSMDIIRKNCKRVLWLERGVLKMDGTPEEVIPMYEKAIK